MMEVTFMYQGVFCPICNGNIFKVHPSQNYWICEDPNSAHSFKLKGRGKNRTWHQLSGDAEILVKVLRFELNSIAINHHIEHLGLQGRIVESDGE